MPALNHPLPHTETLANGLRISLRHTSRLKRCAAALRVFAGSHDVPPAWPGLAHFLEHLLFLGTERFPARQGLMAYVQGHGGQVNASTRERTTDFFFELSPAAFAGGLERLGDMLAHPRMSAEDQLREREVLHAEFIAWSRDAGARQQLALLDGLAADHPLRAFHAGNRYSLNVPRPAFQQALQNFYQAYYHTGQMTLSLVGPQSLDELRAMAMDFSCQLATAAPQPQQPPPRLMSPPASGYQQATAQRLDLLFACEQLPEASQEALEFLCTWLVAGKPGGLRATLVQRQLISSLTATPLYQFAGQALLHIEFNLTALGAGQQPQIREVLLDWLHFFATQADWEALREEYTLLHDCKQQVSSALELARQDSAQKPSGLSDAGVTALKALLSQLQAAPANASGIDWQLPAANPFLRSEVPAPQAGLIRGQTSAHRGLRTFAQDRLRQRRESSAMSFSQALPDDTGEAALYLRWRLDVGMPQARRSHLENSLNSLREDARQAGVVLSLNVSASQCLLQMNGRSQPMPAMLQQALATLASASDEAESMTAPVTPPIAIRQLLKHLPSVIQDATTDTAPTQTVLDLWSTAHWDGLAIGLPAATQGAVSSALAKVPGMPETRPATPAPPRAQKLWHPLPTDSSEQALLLFCPPPDSDLPTEAAWRLLGHLSQTPFYQRLRVELQLGYAVFSTIRQIDGQTGLLFGVQSPTASLAEILEHIGAFLEQLPELIATLDDASLDQQKHTLATQLDVQALPLADAAERLWQGKLAGHPSDYLEQLQQEVIHLSREQLLLACARLRHAEGGWRALASGPWPGEPWQEVK